jgi:hypothetical protein
MFDWPASRKTCSAVSARLVVRAADADWAEDIRLVVEGVPEHAVATTNGTTMAMMARSVMEDLVMEGLGIRGKESRVVLRASVILSSSLPPRAER